MKEWHLRDAYILISPLIVTGLERTRDDPIPDSEFAPRYGCFPKFTDLTKVSFRHRIFCTSES